MKIHTAPWLLCLSLFLVLSTTSCLNNDACDDRVSTEFINGNEQWVPYSNGPEVTVFQKEGEEVFDTLRLDSYEFNVITVQNRDNCDKEETHQLQRASLSLDSSTSTTRIDLFQSSEDVGLFSITHDERELFFFYRNLQFEIQLDLYQYFDSYDLNGQTYTDVLVITCNDEIEPCPNYTRLTYQKGGGLLAYQIDDANWFKVD